MQRCSCDNQVEVWILWTLMESQKEWDPPPPQQHSWSCSVDCNYLLGFKAASNVMFCPDSPCRFIGCYLPGSRDSRHPWILLLGWQAARCLFGKASGRSGESSRAECRCSVSHCSLPNGSRPHSKSMDCDYTTHHGNWCAHLCSQIKAEIIYL